jgi:hypothetical protein
MMIWIRMFPFRIDNVSILKDCEWYGKRNMETYTFATWNDGIIMWASPFA